MMLCLMNGHIVRFDLKTDRWKRIVNKYLKSPHFPNVKNLQQDRIECWLTMLLYRWFNLCKSKLNSEQLFVSLHILYCSLWCLMFAQYSFNQTRRFLMLTNCLWKHLPRKYTGWPYDIFSDLLKCNILRLFLRKGIPCPFVNNKNKVFQRIFSSVEWYKRISTFDTIVHWPSFYCFFVFCCTDLLDYQTLQESGFWRYLRLCKLEFILDLLGLVHTCHRRAEPNIQ